MSCVPGCTKLHAHGSLILQRSQETDIGLLGRSLNSCRQTACHAKMGCIHTGAKEHANAINGGEKKGRLAVDNVAQKAFVEALGASVEASRAH